MSKQLWFYNNNYAMLGVIRGEGNVGKTGIVFLPGLGQTKAGIYFLFSQIAMEIESDFVTLQFDYTGFGDSEGEMEECNLEKLLSDSKKAIELFAEKMFCKEIILIGMGIGNIIAAQCAKILSVVKGIILLSPYKNCLNSYQEFEELIKRIKDSFEVLDTAELGDWDRENFVNEFFVLLGAGMHRNKGLLIRKEFLLEISEVNLEKLIIQSGKTVLLVQAENEKRNIYNVEMKKIFFKKSDAKLQDPDDRNIIINEIKGWIKNRGWEK